jgi:DNA polymerase elongation subunit (family B)
VTVLVGCTPLIVYIELPSDKKWATQHARLIKEKLFPDESTYKNTEMRYLKPLQCKLVERKKLYYVHKNPDMSDKTIQCIQFSLPSHMSLNYLTSVSSSSIMIPSYGTINLKIHENDYSLTPVIRLINSRELPSIGWIKIRPINERKGTFGANAKLTTFDKEYECNAIDVSPVSVEESKVLPMMFPKMFSMDIEAYSSVHSAMPDATKPTDCVFQISVVIPKYKRDPDRKILFTLKHSSPIDGIEIKEYKSETDLLCSFSRFIREENPNIIIGYNILTWDIEYMINRSKLLNCESDFCWWGCYCPKDDGSSYDQIYKKEWSSSAYGPKKFHYIEAEGRLYVDILHVVRASPDKKLQFPDYSLRYVTDQILKKADLVKDTLKIRDMFELYSIGNPDDIARIGMYCVQDSYSTLLLYQTLNIWFDLSEIANIAHVPASYVYVRGQGIRMIPGIHKYCMQTGRIMENQHYLIHSDLEFSGASVITPKIGYWEDVLSFDFCLTGDTLVSLSNGCSRKIGTLMNNEMVLGYENWGVGNYSTINGLQVKGKKDTVKIWLQDGTTICSTPEHKFLLDDEMWSRADQLRDKYVMCGPEYPEDRVCDLENDWELRLGEMTLHMKDYENREKSLAFARILGYILTDGSIFVSNGRKYVFSCFGTILDANDFKKDILRFIEKEPICVDNVPRGKICWYYQKYLFTYETHLDKVCYINWLTKKVKRIPKFIRISHENNDTQNPYPHSHVIIDFGHPLEYRSENYFDYKNIRCNSKIICSRGITHKKDWNKCIQHFITTDPTNSDLISEEVNTDISITKRENDVKGITYAIKLPQKLAIIIHKIPNIIVGKRSTQPMRLPEFILDEKCPTSIVREFLGGMFGGDGSSPYFSSSDNQFREIRFVWTTTEKYKENMEDVFNSLFKLLNRLSIISIFHIPLKVNYRVGDIRPKDYQENPRWNYGLAISADEIIKFKENVGFRYCINKSCRLSVVSSYLKMSHKTKEQCYRVASRTIELEEQKKLPRRICLEMARKEIFEEEPVINAYSLSSSENVNDIKMGEIVKEFKGKPRNRTFPSALDYLVETQTFSWFDKGGHAVGREDVSIPTFRKKVIDVKQDLPQEVYDIEVDIAHSFLSNGVVTHNCSLYPSIIIAYNIDYSTLADDPYLASKGIFNTDIPDSKCNIFEWEEHINCRHDELRGKRNKKKVICGKYRYRFLMPEYGKGVIPSIIVDILTQRKKVKKEMEDICFDEKMEEDKRQELEIKKMILNSRQLALKVMANSMYGSMGSSKSYLSFIPGAMTITRIGRTSIAKVQKENKQISVIYGDSVAKDTPILIKNGNGIIKIQCIEDLASRWEEYPEFFLGDETRREKQQAICDKEVWSDVGWTKIRRIIRHKTSKRMFRICCHTGVLDTTEDHSLLTMDGVEIKPKDIKVGDILMVSTPEIPENDIKSDIDEELAYVMGMFMAEGSCGYYDCPSGQKTSWAINNQDKELLKKCRDILNSKYPKYVFKIYETMESSDVYKLCVTSGEEHGVVLNFVKEYRNLFYREKHKIVPNEILNSSIGIRQAFFDGYYEGDGDKDGICKRFDCKGKIGSFQLYCLALSLGYKCSVNTRYDKMDIYRVTITKAKQRKAGGKVKKIYDLGIEEDFVYDLETECGHFMAGVGNIIAHNTDSIFVRFEDQKMTVREYLTEAEKIVEHMKTIFPEPMSLEFDGFHKKFLLLSKKRYAEILIDKNGNLSDIKSKGTLLVKRDFALVVKSIYGGIINLFFNDRKQEIPDYILDEYQKIFTRQYPTEKFIVTKSMSKSIGEYTGVTIPAHVALAKRMIERGQEVVTGSRLRYVFTTEGRITDKQSEKIEEVDFFNDHREIMRLDYLYYLKSQYRQVDDLVSLIFEKELEEIENPKHWLRSLIIHSMSKNQLKLRLLKYNTIEQIKDFKRPKIIFVE